MEPSFLFTIASSMIGKLLGEVVFDNIKKEDPVQKPKIQIEYKVEKRELRVPSFVSHIPKGCFVGVSSGCQNLQEARRSALVDVMKQIVSSAGCQYQYEFMFSVKGDAKQPRKFINEQFNSYSSGLILELEKNLQKCEFSIDERGQYVSFVLVDYPYKLLQEVKRLAKGAEVSIVVKERKGVKYLTVQEINDVRITVLSAWLKVEKLNHYSKAISLFICKVPEKQNETINLQIDPFSVQNNSIVVPLTNVPEKSLKGILLGSEFEFELGLDCVDEIGRRKQISCQL